MGNGWLICPADNDLVFDAEVESKYDRAMAKLGVHPSFLVSDAAPFINGECVTIDGGEWLAAGGEFNHLTRLPREQVKSVMRRMRR